MIKPFLLCLALALSACATEPPIEPIRLDFSGLEKIRLDAGDLNVIDRSKTTPRWKPYIGHLFSPTLSEATHGYVADRLLATGSAGHATFIIKDANVTEQALELHSGISSYFTRQQAHKYTGRIEVSLEAQSPADGHTASATANAVHSVTLPEDPTEQEKQNAYSKLIVALMGTLNRNFEQALKTHMGRFLLAHGQPMPESQEIAPTLDSAMPLPLTDGRP